MSAPRRNMCRGMGFVMCLATGLLGACATTHSDENNHAMAVDLAQLLVSHHAYETAVPILQRGIAENPRDAVMRRLLGTVLRDRGLFDEAQRELQIAGTLAPEDPETYAALGVLNDMRGRPLVAETFHRRALAMAPGRADFYNNLGFSLYLQHRDAEAAVAYNEALHRDPTLRRAYNNLGFAQARLGRHEDALHSFEQAGSKAAALASLGLAYELAGDKASARGLYEEALVLDRKLVVAQRNLHNLRAANEAAEEHDSAPRVNAPATVGNVQQEQEKP